MFPYWLMFLMPAWAALNSRAVGTATDGPRRVGGAWTGMLIVLTLMVGFRHQVGGDWYRFAVHVIRAGRMTWSESLLSKDPAYGLLNWLGARWGDVYLINTVCGILFVWGLAAFCRQQPRPWLALVVAVPYLVTIVAMGYTRQSVAVGLEMLGLVALQAGRIPRYMMCIAAAATFHKSAVIMAPVAALAASHNRVLTLLLVGMVGFLLYVLLLEKSADALMMNYVERAYASSGAAIRLAMNAVPAVLFLLYRRRFELPKAQLAFWTWMSLGALGFAVLLVVSPASAAIDRVALYWIPLQLFVWSRIPDALWHFGGSKRFWVRAVVGYSAAVYFVWLNYASHAHLWLPYQFYPWVAFWE